MIDTATLVDAVRDRVSELADRGVFNGWQEARTGKDKAVFSFRWLLGAEFCLVVDARKQLVVVKEVLPAIEHRSYIDRDLRRFIAARSSTALPNHRRLAPEAGELKYTNRKGQVSLALTVLDDDCEPAIKGLLTTLNDLFAYLHLYHIDYLHREFGVPEE